MLGAASSELSDSATQALLSSLQAQIVSLEERLRKAEQDRDEYRKLVALLRVQNESLKRGLFSQKTERLTAKDRLATEAQLSMALLGLSLGGATAPDASQSPAPEPEQSVDAHTRKKPVRKPPPATLPRVHIEILPPEVERQGLDAFTYIGSETREVLERRPASVVVVEIEYKKFVPKGRDPIAATTVLAPPTVELPIVRGTAGPSLLASTIVQRWQDHLPLHRLEGIYGREGLSLPRSTLCTWHAQLAALARPLVDAMFIDVRCAPYVCVDATGVLVQDKERCRHGHFWVLVAPERHVLYRYSQRHTKEAVDALLPGYKGYLVVDAHVVYDHLFKDGTVLEVGCWAHGRRYFFKALESDPERARQALSYITALFRIERELATASRSHREQVRRLKSKPLVDQFYQWCDTEAETVLDLSPIATAIGYVRHQRSALQRFLEDGRLPLHNNISELNLRRQVVGRHNWLFCGSDDGAEVNTVFVSLLASCQLHHIEPLAYLRDLLCLLPRWSQHRVLELAPLHWQHTLQQPETQQFLAANPLRRVVLGL